MGHGALVYDQGPFEFGKDGFDVVVTGPRRSMFRGEAGTTGEVTGAIGEVTGAIRESPLRPYYAVPFGDMMIAGCFGLVAATGEVMPELGEEIRESMRGASGRGATPWDVGE
jgi:hypothetical protein